MTILCHREPESVFQVFWLATEISVMNLKDTASTASNSTQCQWYKLLSLSWSRWCLREYTRISCLWSVMDIIFHRCSVPSASALLLLRGGYYNSSSSKYFTGDHSDIIFSVSGKWESCYCKHLLHTTKLCSPNVYAFSIVKFLRRKWVC